MICSCRRADGPVNKGDVHDAKGLAQMVRTAWFKAIGIKQDATDMDRAALNIRDQLIDAHQAMVRQLRGLLKLFSLRLGQAKTPNERRERL